MMPDRGTRGIWPIAEAGESPQSKLYGAKSTRSNKTEKNSASDVQSLIMVAPLLISLSSADDVFLCVIDKYNTTLLIDTTDINIIIVVNIVFEHDGFLPYRMSFYITNNILIRLVVFLIYMVIQKIKLELVAAN